MTGAGAVAGPRPIVPAREGGVWSVVRTERRKLLAQPAIRMLAVACVAGPFAFAALLKIQSGTPSDALLGVFVHSSGYAISLVVLGFAATWGFPLIAGVVSGDMFSSEDRHGTWKTILTRSCSRGELFAGKVLTAFGFTTALVAVTALSSLVAGVVLVGNQSLVSLGGELLSPGASLLLVLVSWLVCLFPALAYTSVAILISVVTRNGIVGVIGPILLSLLTQLLDLIGKGVWVHLLLVGSAFDGWHGLLTTPAFAGPLLVSLAVSLGWIAVCLTASWRLIRRRDFAGTTVGLRAGWPMAVRAVAGALVVFALLAIAANLGPVGVTRARLTSHVTSEFNAITLVQERELGRVAPPGARFLIKPTCYKHAAASEGPGDWTCMMDVYLPSPGKVPFQQAAVSYDVSVQANGCYKAQSPPTFVGQPTMRNLRGQNVVNPLFIVYGCFNIL